MLYAFGLAAGEKTRSSVSAIIAAGREDNLKREENGC